MTIFGRFLSSQEWQTLLNNLKSGLFCISYSTNQYKSYQVYKIYNLSKHTLQL